MTEYVQRAETLMRELRDLRSVENRTISDIVKDLSEMDRDGLFREAGYSSLFALCRGIGYSEGASMRRIQAARCMTRHPEVYDMLRDGTLTLCSISEL